MKEFKAAYGETPDGLAAMGYDAMAVLAEALKKTPDYTTPGKLRDTLAATANHPGVTGMITLNALRNPIKPAVVLKVEGKDFKYSTTIQPKAE